MCVLCWQSFTEQHWTEQRFEAGESAATASAGSDRERSRRRHWTHRRRVVNHILSHYGLQLDDWHSRSYVLSDRKGKTQDINCDSNKSTPYRNSEIATETTSTTALEFRALIRERRPCKK